MVMPVIWLIDAYRAGEQSQVRALVDALGWPCETKQLAYRKHIVLPHVLGLASLSGITTQSRGMLEPPWPDLVISSGVRNEPVCRWIRAHSGGRTRYVHVGRPWGPLGSFDLVITTPQYRVPGCRNVLNNTLTLHGVTPQRLEAARRQWAPAFEHLPRPRIAVVAGGDSGPFTLGPLAASRLALHASTLARQGGGSLLVSTSSRTSAAAIDALQAGIDVPNYFYRWQASDPANPYFGMLAAADRRGETDVGVDFRLGATMYAALMRWAWRRLSRDITLVHQQLRATSRAFWLDEESGASVVPAESDMQRAVAAVQGLFGQS